MVTWVLDLSEGATFGVFTAENGDNVIVKVTRGPLGMSMEPIERADTYTHALDRAEYLNAYSA